jgi:hypothetical protein
MRKHCRLAGQLLRSFAYLLLPVLIALASSAAAQQTQTGTGIAITPEMRDGLSAIAKSFNYRDDDGVTRVLRERNFPPVDWGGIWTDFANWPTEHKLRAGYNSVQAESGRGKEFIEEVALELATSNEALRYDRALTFLRRSGAAVTPTKFQFRQLQAASALAELPPDIAKIVRAVARYVGPRHALMRVLGGSCCGLKGESVADVMQTHAKVEEILAEFIRTGVLPPDIAERLARLQIDVARLNELLLYDKIFERSRDALKALQRTYTKEDYAKLVASVREDIAPGAVEADWLARGAVTQLREAEKTLTEGIGKKSLEGRAAAQAARSDIESLATTLAPAVAPSSASQPAGGPPQSPGPSSRRFEAFERSAFGGGGGGASGRSYPGMRRVPFGHGGVVLGAEVTSAPDLPQIVTLSFVPRESLSVTPGPNSQAWGHLLLTFEDATTGYSAPVRKDHAVAAARLAFASDAAEGQGFGLAGIETGRGSRAVLGTVTKAGLRVELTGHGFLVNPAVARLPLAKEVMMVDATGFNRSISDDLLDALKGRQSVHRIEEYRNWFASPRGFFKFTDRPVRIERSGDGLITARARLGTSAIDRDGKMPHLYLDFQAFREGKPVDDFASPLSLMLASLFGDLIEVSPDFRSLNDFVEVLAIFRLANRHQATWYGVEDVAEHIYPYGSLFRRGPSHYVFGPSSYALNVSLLERVEQEARGLLSDAPPTLAAEHARVFASWQGSVAKGLARSLLGQMQQRVRATGQNEVAGELASLASSRDLPPGLDVDALVLRALKESGQSSSADQIVAQRKAALDFGLARWNFDIETGVNSVRKQKLRALLNQEQLNSVTNQLLVKSKSWDTATVEDISDALGNLAQDARKRAASLYGQADAWRTTIQGWADIWGSLEQAR